MENRIVRNLGILVGGADGIVSLLGIGALPADGQEAIVGRFSDILLKRILLRVPEGRVEEVRRLPLLAEATPEKIAELLELVIPDFDRVVREETERTVRDFRS